MSLFRPTLPTPSRDVFLEEVWFRLAHLQSIGNKALWKIALHCGEELLSGNFEKDWPLLKQGPLAEKETELLNIYEDNNLGQYWQQLQAQQIALLHPQHSLLQQLFGPLQAGGTYRSHLPSLLYYWGNIEEALSLPTVGIVGARRATPYILEQSQCLSSALAKKGKCVLSGYARGVDTQAHAGAINAKNRTIAVLPHGISSVFERDKDFPQLKDRLSVLLRQSEWKEQLLFLSQFHPNSRWKPQYYILRNHTICALSHKIIIMASEHERSGSYQTGAFAEKIGVSLYVFMPKKRSEQSLGNRLLCKQPNTVALDEEELLPTLSK